MIIVNVEEQLLKKVTCLSNFSHFIFLPELTRLFTLLKEFAVKFSIYLFLFKNEKINYNQKSISIRV